MGIVNSSIIRNTIIKNTIINSSIIGSGDGSNPLAPYTGWTGDEYCSSPSVLMVSVSFNQEVSYTDHTGVTITHDNGGVFTITGSTASPTKLIQYDGTWDVAPVDGDIVTYTYSSGNYVDGDDVPMEDASIVITNCFDITPIVGGQLLTSAGETFLTSTSDNFIVAGA